MLCTIDDFENKSFQEEIKQKYGEYICARDFRINAILLISTRTLY